jgi:hypothetical protein
MNVAPVAIESKPARSISLRPSRLADPLLDGKIALTPIVISV